MRHHPLGDPAGAYDCRLRRHDDEIGKPTSDHAEIRQRNRRAAQLSRGYRARDGVSPQSVKSGSQIRYASLCDIAEHGNDEAASGIHGDAEIDALDQAIASRNCTRH